MNPLLIPQPTATITHGITKYFLKEPTMRVPGKVIVGICLVALGGIMLTLGGCSKREDPWPEGKGKRVLVSFAPLYCFTKKVAGDDARVLCLLTSQGPHDYEPTANDALKVRKADLFFINGLALERKDFVERLKNNSGNKDLRVVAVAEALPKELKEKHEEEKGKDHHDHGEWDPHVWLGIEQAKRMVQTICKELSDLDPDHKKDFEKRAADFQAELDNLHKYGKDALANKKNRKLITQHESLDYFAKSFDLDIVGSIQPKAGSEPSEQEKAQLVKECKEKDVKVIAFEPQYMDKQAKTIKSELENKGVKGVQIIELDPLETAPPDLTADYYITRMRQNLDELKKALP
jgi:ABC-type Zn uptake system ZnuABC Zn-binding protein ZnuA